MMLRMVGLAVLTTALGCGGSVTESPSVDAGLEASAQPDVSVTMDSALDSGLDAAGLDAGDTCKPLPNCDSGTTCPATDGCNTCSCEQGVWECTGYECPSEGGNIACDGQWARNEQPCTMNDQLCSFPLPPGYMCSTYACQCVYGNWFCQQTNCGDAGLNVGGNPDGGGNIQPYGCPVAQPAPSSSCPANGALCRYGQCPTFCLCDTGQWDCAPSPQCGDE